MVDTINRNNFVAPINVGVTPQAKAAFNAAALTNVASVSVNSVVASASMLISILTSKKGNAKASADGIVRPTGLPNSFYVTSNPVRSNYSRS
jgi:hypothetical protein